MLGGARCIQNLYSSKSIDPALSKYSVICKSQDVPARRQQCQAVDDASCRGEETVLTMRGFGPDGPHPPARGECLSECVSWGEGVGLNLTCMPPGLLRHAGPKGTADCSRLFSGQCQLMHCSLNLFLAEAAVHQRVMEEVRMVWMIAMQSAHHHL